MANDTNVIQLMDVIEGSSRDPFVGDFGGEVASGAIARDLARDSSLHLTLCGIMGLTALVPYALFIFCTFGYRSLFLTRNIVRANFAVSASLHLASIVLPAYLHWWGGSELPDVVRNVSTVSTRTELRNSDDGGSAGPQAKDFPCPEVTLLWWSSVDVVVSILLMELDRFLAIRFPLTYPIKVTDERALFGCILGQVYALGSVLVARVAAGDPDAFRCAEEEATAAAANDVAPGASSSSYATRYIRNVGRIRQDPLFFWLVLLPYYFCISVSLVFSLYVIRVATRKSVSSACRVRPAWTVEADFRRRRRVGPPRLPPPSRRGRGRDLGVRGNPPEHKRRRSEIVFPVSTCLTEKAPRPSSSGPKLCRTRKVSNVFQELSCQGLEAAPAGPVAASDTGAIINCKVIEGLRNDLRHTFRALFTMLMYLLITLPSFVPATIYSGCRRLHHCDLLFQCILITDKLSLASHVVLPVTWLCFDKLYSRKLVKTFRIWLNLW